MHKSFLIEALIFQLIFFANGIEDLSWEYENYLMETTSSTTPSATTLNPQSTTRKESYVERIIRIRAQEQRLAALNNKAGYTGSDYWLIRLRRRTRNLEQDTLYREDMKITSPPPERMANSAGYKPSTRLLNSLDSEVYYENTTPKYKMKSESKKTVDKLRENIKAISIGEVGLERPHTYNFIISTTFRPKTAMVSLKPTATVPSFDYQIKPTFPSFSEWRTTTPASTREQAIVRELPMRVNYGFEYGNWRGRSNNENQIYRSLPDRRNSYWRKNGAEYFGQGFYNYYPFYGYY